MTVRRPRPRPSGRLVRARPHGPRSRRRSPRARPRTRAVPPPRRTWTRGGGTPGTSRRVRPAVPRAPALRTDRVRRASGARSAPRSTRDPSSLHPQKGRAEPAHAEERARLHGAERQLEPLGDPRLREASVIHQLDHLALLPREPVEGGADGLALLRNPELLDDHDRRILDLDLRKRFRRSALAGLLAANGVDRLVMGHPHQPSAHRAALGVVAPRVSPHRQEHLLDDLLREERLADDPPSDAEGGRSVPAEQPPEGVLVAVPDAAHELAIASAGEVNRLHDRAPDAADPSPGAPPGPRPIDRLPPSVRTRGRRG